MLQPLAHRSTEIVRPVDSGVVSRRIASSSCNKLPISLFAAIVTCFLPGSWVACHAVFAISGMRLVYVACFVSFLAASHVLATEESCAATVGRRIVNDDGETLELVQVVVVHRHGDRTPIAKHAGVFSQVSVTCLSNTMLPFAVSCCAYCRGACCSFFFCVALSAFCLLLNDVKGCMYHSRQNLRPFGQRVWHHAWKSSAGPGV